MDQTEQYRQLLVQVEKENILPPGENVLIPMLQTLIRSNELVHRYNEYFSNGYNLGYFLIQSQRIEQTVRGVIESAERLRTIVSGAEKTNIDTSIPLGALIVSLKNYISSFDIFKRLIEFNKYRIAVIHRINDDHSRNLLEIEESIATDYPPNRINDLQSLLLEVNMRINQKIVEQMGEEMTIAKEVGAQLVERMEKEIGASGLEFQIL